MQRWNLTVFGPGYIRFLRGISFVKKHMMGCGTQIRQQRYVSMVLYQQEPSVITEADLLENARKVYGKYAQFMLSLQQERKEIKK